MRFFNVSFPRLMAFALLFLWSGCFMGKCRAQRAVVDPYRFGGFPSGLVGYYKMDEAASATTRADSSGNGNTLQRIETSSGTITNKPFKITAAIGPTISQALWGYAGTTNSAFNFDTSSFTVAFWIADTSSGVHSSTAAIMFGQQEASLQWQFFWNDAIADRMTFYVHRSGGSDNVQYTNNSGVGVFVFVVATYKNNGGAAAGNLSISINNGTPVTGNTAVANSTLNTPSIKRFAIGSYINTAVFNMRDPIDEIGIWNRVLTAAEITYLYNSGNGRQP